MSHFSVIVVGEDYEKQLAPYHEFECTGIVDEFVQDVDKTDEVKEEAVRYLRQGKNEAEAMEKALSYHGLDENIVSDEADVDRKGRHKYGFAVVKDGKLIKAVARTNPNAKWDWYSLGGRWAGFFKMKNGCRGVSGSPGILTERAKPGYADQARKGDIDFEGMRDEAERAARDKYFAVEKLFGGEIPRLETSWEELLEITGISKARDIFWAQPAHKKLLEVRDRLAKSGDPADRDLRDLAFCLNLSDYQCSVGEFAQRARDGAISSFAVVKDGKWYERGQMGWWGVVHNEQDKDKWNREVTGLLEDLPEDTILTVVDCHI